MNTYLYLSLGRFIVYSVIMFVLEYLVLTWSSDKWYKH